METADLLLQRFLVLRQLPTPEEVQVVASMLTGSPLPPNIDIELHKPLLLAAQRHDFDEQTRRFLTAPPAGQVDEEHVIISGKTYCTYTMTPDTRDAWIRHIRRFLILFQCLE